MSTELSKEEQDLIQRRREGIDTFLNERMPILKGFMEDLGYEEPYLVLLQAERFIPSLSDYLHNQLINKEDKNWIITVIGYFIGEVFAQKYNGVWFLNEDSNSNTFGRYLVGGLQNAGNTSIDSFEIAYNYINQKENRNLALTIENIEKQIYKD